MHHVLHAVQGTADKRTNKNWTRYSTTLGRPINYEMSDGSLTTKTNTLKNPMTWMHTKFVDKVQ